MKELNTKKSPNINSNLKRSQHYKSLKPTSRYEQTKRASVDPESSKRDKQLVAEANIKLK